MLIGKGKDKVFKMSNKYAMVAVKNGVVGVEGFYILDFNTFNIAECSKEKVARMCKESDIINISADLKTNGDINLYPTFDSNGRAVRNMENFVVLSRIIVNGKSTNFLVWSPSYGVQNFSTDKMINLTDNGVVANAKVREGFIYSKRGSFIELDISEISANKAGNKEIQILYICKDVTCKKDYIAFVIKDDNASEMGNIATALDRKNNALVGSLLKGGDSSARNIKNIAMRHDTLYATIEISEFNVLCESLRLNKVYGGKELLILVRNSKEDKEAKAYVGESFVKGDDPVKANAEKFVEAIKAEIVFGKGLI